MVRLLATIFSLSLALSASADPGREAWERLENMVRAGVITRESARKEQAQSRSQDLEARGSAQRALASVHPSLRPLKVRRMELPPMELSLD